MFLQCFQPGGQNRTPKSYTEQPVSVSTSLCQLSNIDIREYYREVSTYSTGHHQLLLHDTVHVHTSVHTLDEKTKEADESFIDKYGGTYQETKDAAASVTLDAADIALAALDELPAGLNGIVIQSLRPGMMHVQDPR